MNLAKYAGLKSRTLHLSSRLNISLQRSETGKNMFITIETASFKYTDQITKYSDDETGEFYRFIHTEKGRLGLITKEWRMFNELIKDVTPDYPSFISIGPSTR